MSRSAITRTYHCCNDCRQEGCPGHTLTLEYDHTSDTVSIIEDSRTLHTFDRTQWRTLINMDVALRGSGFGHD